MLFWILLQGEVSIINDTNDMQAVQIIMRALEGELAIEEQTILMDTDGDREPDNIDVDDNGNGLIEISTINMLNNIRNNLAGTTYTDTPGGVGNTTGCGNGNDISSCNGYELVQNLDFTNPNHYNNINLRGSLTTGMGWKPIGGDFAGQFTGIFDGKHYTH